MFTDNSKKIKTHTRDSGFVILFAIIISAIIMLIGAGIFSIALKETILSSTVAESSIGIFAADTGMECALYHEYVEKSRGWDPAVDGVFDCGLDLGISEESVSGGSIDEYQFSFAIDGTPSCGQVVVLRNRTRFGDLVDPDSNEAGTLIVSRGFNFCVFPGSGPEPNTSNQFLVERRLEAWYPNQSLLDENGNPLDEEDEIDDEVTPENGNEVQ